MLLIEEIILLKKQSIVYQEREIEQMQKKVAEDKAKVLLLEKELEQLKTGKK